MITPAKRVHYSSLVLMLADAALERLRSQLAERGQADGGYDSVGFKGDCTP